MNIATARTMLAPLAMLNRRTATPLLIYMAAGASGLAVVAETFWIRERLALSPQALLALAAWLTVPWTLKMVFGHLVDTVPVLGSAPARSAWWTGRGNDARRLRAEQLTRELALGRTTRCG